MVLAMQFNGVSHMRLWHVLLCKHLCEFVVCIQRVVV